MQQVSGGRRAEEREAGHRCRAIGGGQSGSFTYSYPVPVPNALHGAQVLINIGTVRVPSMTDEANGISASAATLLHPHPVATPGSRRG